MNVLHYSESLNAAVQMFTTVLIYGLHTSIKQVSLMILEPRKFFEEFNQLPSKLNASSTRHVSKLIVLHQSYCNHTYADFQYLFYLIQQVFESSVITFLDICFFYLSGDILLYQGILI